MQSSACDKECRDIDDEEQNEQHDRRRVIRQSERRNNRADERKQDDERRHLRHVLAHVELVAAANHTTPQRARIIDRFIPSQINIRLLGMRRSRHERNTRRSRRGFRLDVPDSLARKIAQLNPHAEMIVCGASVSAL